MSRRNFNLKLDCSLRSIEGAGDELTFKVGGHRKQKTGDYAFYELELKACRFSVTQILRELRKMHIRDRDRLSREAQRIESEISQLTKENA